MDRLTAFLVRLTTRLAPSPRKWRNGSSLTEAQYRAEVLRRAWAALTRRWAARTEKIIDMDGLPAAVEFTADQWVAWEAWEEKRKRFFPELAVHGIGFTHPKGSLIVYVEWPDDSQWSNYIEVAKKTINVERDSGLYIEVK